MDSLSLIDFQGSYILSYFFPRKLMDKGVFWEVMKAVHIRTNKYMARNLGISYPNL